MADFLHFIESLSVGNGGRDSTVCSETGLEKPNLQAPPFLYMLLYGCVCTPLTKVESSSSLYWKFVFMYESTKAQKSCAESFGCGAFSVHNIE